MKTTKKTTFTEKLLLKYRPFFWSFGNTTTALRDKEHLQAVYVVEESKGKKF